MSFAIKKHQLFLLAPGAFILSLSFIIDHYFSLPDFISGLIKGIALGLMLLSLRGGVRGRNKESGVGG